MKENETKIVSLELAVSPSKDNVLHTELFWQEHMVKEYEQSYILIIPTLSYMGKPFDEPLSV